MKIMKNFLMDALDGAHVGKFIALFLICVITVPTVVLTVIWLLWEVCF